MNGVVSLSSAGDFADAPSKIPDPPSPVSSSMSSEVVDDLSIGGVRKTPTKAPPADGERNSSSGGGGGRNRAKRRRNGITRTSEEGRGGSADAKQGRRSTETADTGRPHSATAHENSSGGGGDHNGGNGGEKPIKRKRHRRQKRRKWKPYHKLSTEEKRQLEEREAKRAEKTRAERMAHGQPMAPYNTTQFLLEDRVAQNQEPDVDALMETIERERRNSFRERDGASGSMASDDSSRCLATDSEIEREFEAEYERATAERLESLSKPELIRDYLLLEQELEKTKEQLETSQRTNASLRVQATTVSSRRSVADISLSTPHITIGENTVAD